MRLSHVGHHLVAYWNSLRPADAREPEGHTLGAHLRCPVFVINLERSRHRRDYMLNYLSGHGIEARIFPAVDGAALDVAQLQRQGIYDDEVAHQKFNRSLSPAEIACTLSHLNIHRKMVGENISMALVLEDDAMFGPRIVSRVSGALSEAPPDWDVLQLSHNCEEYVGLTENLVRFPSNTRMPVGSAGYLIRKGGAEKMLANGFPICYPADSLMGRSHRWGVVLYGFAPPVVVQNAVFPTQIYTPSSWRIRLTQALKQALVSAFGSLARAFGGPQ
jgi:GR25 family glycosyltransferase involved in LPS biosynthesis